MKNIHNNFNYKLLVIDLDGTLLNQHNKITERNIEALKKLSSMGCKFMIATGRQLTIALAFFKKIGLPASYLISYNGSVIYDLKANKVIYDKALNNSKILEIIEFIKKYKYNFLISGKEYFISAKPHDNFWDKESISQTELKVVPFKKELLQSSDIFYKMTLIFNETEEIKEKLYSYIVDEFCNSFEFCKTKGHDGEIFTEINNLNISKGNALAIVAEKLGISLSDMMAVGDSGNDSSMLKIVGLSFCPINATPVAKKAAKVVLNATNDEHIIEAIYNYFQK